MTRLIRRAVVLAALVTCQSVAQNFDNYEAVLVPFHSWYQTAGGPVGTEVWLRNEGDTPLEMFPANTGFFGRCLITSRTIPPRSTLFALSDVLSDSHPFVPLQVNEPPGAFLWFERAGIENLTTTALFTVSQLSTMTSSTAYPLVRSSELRTGIVSIPSVEHRADSRYMIRVYGGPDTPAQAEVRVNIYAREARGARPEVLRKSEVLTLQRSFETFPDHCIPDVLPDVPMKPAYSQTADLPAPDPAFSPAWRIEFVPSDSTLRYWAVVSATNNTTNAITLYTISN